MPARLLLFLSILALSAAPSASDDPGTSRFLGETIVGHGVQANRIPFDAVGRAALLPSSASNLLASHDGRRLYLFSRAQVLRFDLEDNRLETLAGLGWPGYHDGPASTAQFDINFYQAGGHGLSPDGRYLYLLANGVIRRIDTATGETATLWNEELAGKGGLRSLAVGSHSGKLYLLFYSGYYVMDPETDSLRHYPLDLQSGNGWGKGRGGPPGYIAVDEERGVVYGVKRNRKSGAFYRWPIDGGVVEWLNHRATGNRGAQYTSDGPVSTMQMANPSGCVVDDAGFVYIGAGDGRTFRRFDPETDTVLSLCRADGASSGKNTLEWCRGDGKRNRVFGTWPGFLAFDNAGNRYLGYGVWPRLVRLKRISP